MCRWGGKQKGLLMREGATCVQVRPTRQGQVEKWLLLKSNCQMCLNISHGIQRESGIEISPAVLKVWDTSDLVT